MKKSIYKLTLVFSLLSCNNQINEKKIENTILDTLQTISTNEIHDDIYIKDKTQYDQTFLNGLSDYNDKIKLIDNFIIVGSDTTYFPEDLTLNKTTIFKAIKENNKYLLSIKRTNLTNLEYNFELKDLDNKTLATKSGKAILGSMFFLAPEGEDDIETGDSFFSQQYGIENDSLWLGIKVGMDKNYKGKKRAKIFYGQIINGKMTEPIIESPILRAE